jgi:ribosomal-protein-alanine N-acetyltransferase
MTPSRIPDVFPELACGDHVQRRIAAADAADCDRYRADAEVTRYTSIDAAREPAADGIAYLSQAFAEKREIRWAIAPKSTGVMVGDCGLFQINDAHSRAEVGYVLAREHWGHGVATAAMRAMLRWGFDTLELHRVEAIIHPQNAGSIRVAEKCGFVFEGTLRERTLIGGRFEDMLSYSLLASEFAG